MDATEELSFIPTKCSQQQKNLQSSFECIVFENKRKNSTKATSVNKQEMNDDKTLYSDVTVKRLKREVIKYGMTGFDAKKKQEAKIEQAIRLGAKPPKNKYLNYKDFKTLKARQAKEDEEEKMLKNAGKIGGVSSDKGRKYLAMKKRKEKKKESILQSYGKVSVNFKQKKSRRKR